MFDAGQLRLARDVRGMKQVELADLLGVKPSAVSQFEHGHSRPSPSTLTALALALDFPIAFFATNAHRQNPHSFFRSRRSTSAGSRRQAEGTTELLFRLTDAIERHVILPDIDIPRFPSSSRGSPEDAAREVRRRWEIAPGPIKNVVRLLEQHGVVVARTLRGSEEIDAFSRPFEPRPIIVLAADKKDRARSRFDAAHELGHLVMHGDVEGTRQVEDEAQRFAAEFLMPSDEVRRHLPVRLDWDRLVKLKFHWGTSIKSILMRARALGVMPESTYVRAMKIYSSRGWSKAEPGDLGAPESPRLLQKAVELLEASSATIVDLSRQARLNVAEVERLLGEAGDIRPRIGITDWTDAPPATPINRPGRNPASPAPAASTRYRD